MPDLDSLFGSPDLDALTDQLTRRAETEGLLDMTHRRLDSPIGPLLLAATPLGLVKIAFENENHDAVLERLAEVIGPRILPSARQLDPVARELDEYFEQRRTVFTVPVDLRLSHGFRRDVLDQLQRVRFGETVSYAELAVRSGNAKASRAVGSACATNPIPIIVPCHRVLRTDGSLGGYAGGLPAKRFLLDLENPVLV